MKSKKIILGTVLILSITAGAIGFGKNSDVSYNNSNSLNGWRSLTVFNKLDLNKDGVISKEEFLNGSTKSKNTVVGKRINALYRMLPAGIKNYFDKNGNGVIDPEEKEALTNFLNSRRQKFRENILPKYDENGNGFLDGNERIKLREDMQVKINEFIKKYDLNKDGKLDKNEIDEIPFEELKNTDIPYIMLRKTLRNNLRKSKRGARRRNKNYENFWF
jgi:Ca2+-binding EF-hand superfamily protein